MKPHLPLAKCFLLAASCTQVVAATNQINDYRIGLSPGYSAADRQAVITRIKSFVLAAPQGSTLDRDDLRVFGWVVVD